MPVEVVIPGVELLHTRVMGLGIIARIGLALDHPFDLQPVLSRCHGAMSGIVLYLGYGRCYRPDLTCTGDSGILEPGLQYGRNELQKHRRLASG